MIKMLFSDFHYFQLPIGSWRDASLRTIWRASQAQLQQCYSKGIIDSTSYAGGAGCLHYISGSVRVRRAFEPVGTVGRRRRLGRRVRPCSPGRSCCPHVRRLPVRGLAPSAASLSSPRVRRCVHRAALRASPGDGPAQRRQLVSRDGEPALLRRARRHRKPVVRIRREVDQSGGRRRRCGARRGGARPNGCGAKAARRPADVTMGPWRFPIRSWA